MEQKEKFYELLDKYCSEHKKQTCVITQDLYDKVLNAIHLNSGAKCNDGAKFKHWCKNYFKVETIGARNLLYCGKTSLPVTTKEDMFDTILRCHLRVGHKGRDKTFDEVKKNYSWINRKAVQMFLQTCPTCNTRQPLKKPKAGKPIISLGFLTRVQVDLIDMTSRPDEDYKWILHARDHFTKYSWAYPLTSKRADEVAEKLTEIFCSFGPAKILQSDNGKEFAAKVINEIANMWPGLVIIHGRPRHPQSQGCVERGNGDLQVKLGKWVDENGEQWSKGLKFVVHAINTSTAKATGKTPYELVFGQRPREDFFTLQTLADQNIVNEEDIDAAMLEEAADAEPPHNDGDTASSEASSTTEEISRPDFADSEPLQDDGDTSVTTDWSSRQSSSQDVDSTDTQAAALLLHLSSGIPVEATEEKEINKLWDILEPVEPSDNDNFPPTVSNAQTPQLDSGPNQVIVTAHIHTPTKQVQNPELKCATPRSTQKRNRVSQLYADGNIVAEGHVQQEATSVHGTTINTETHVVVEVSSVFDTDFVPTENNPFDEPLQEGQYVSWKKSCLLEDEPDTPHAKVRKLARDNYLATAKCQTSKYQNKVAHLQKSFQPGDTVGIKINKVDRTNTGASVLPCKVLSVKPNVRCPYKLYTPSGILNVNYSSDDMLDLRHVVFSGLENLDARNLKEVSLIKASRDCSGWSNATTDTSLCSCSESCINKQCKCRKAGLKCSTKCHPNSTCCQNKF